MSAPTRPPGPPQDNQFQTYFDEFEKTCPLYTGKTFFKKRKCTKACSYLIKARDEAENTGIEENISKIIGYCNGNPDVEPCGRAVNLYDRQKKIMEEKGKL